MKRENLFKVLFGLFVLSFFAFESIEVFKVHLSPLYHTIYIAFIFIIGTSYFIEQEIKRKHLLNQLNVDKSILENEVSGRTQLISNQEQELKVTSERMKQLMNSIEMGIVEIDERSLAIVSANEAAAKILGTTRKELIGKRCDILCSQKDCINPNFRCPAMLQPTTVEVDVVNQITGSKVPIIKKIRRVPVNDHCHIIESFIDITERKSIENELIKSDLAKTNVLKNLAHEIGNTITPILHSIEHDLKNKLHSDVLDPLKANIDRLTLVVAIMRNHGTLQKGIQDINPAPLDIEAFMKYVYDSSKLIANKQPGVDYILDLPKEKIGWLICDGSALNMTIPNLIGNALKFTDVGRVVVKARKKNIKGNISLIISVKDTGIGIAVNQFQRIFGIETQVAGTKDKYGGFGLGLAMAKQYAIMMGGDIDVESVLGKGSIFTVTLPNMKETKEVVVSNEKKGVIKGMNVIIVDDTVSIRTVFKSLLITLGVRVLTCETGQEVLDNIWKDNYDAILTDISMPEMDGIELYHKIREERFNMPIIAVTGRGFTSDIEELKGHGFNDVIVKPMQPNIVASVLQNIFENSLFDHKYYDSMYASMPIDVYKSVYNAYVSEFREKLERIKEGLNHISSLSEDDISEIGSLLHSLKGSGITACLSSIYNIVYCLERLVKSDQFNTEEYQQLISNLIEKIEKNYKKSTDYVEVNVLLDV